MIECVVLLVVFVFGYELGRRNGWQTGFTQAEAATPLRLRQESLEHGQCILCQALPTQSPVAAESETKCSNDT